MDAARKYATSRMGSVRATTTTAAASATSATWDISSTPTAKVGSQITENYTKTPGY